MDDPCKDFDDRPGASWGSGTGPRDRYSDGLRQRAVAYWRTREPEGDGLGSAP
jgi:hypothetical protein